MALGALVLFVGLPLAVWRGPYLLDSNYLDTGTIGEGPGSAALVTGLRTAMVTCIASIGAGIALFYTARNYRLNRRGQVTDRFTKALERLDSEHIYVRIGGILALEQIVRDAPEQATDAAHVLGHFVRHMRPPTSADRPDADVQTALTALTRPELRTHADPSERLDLELLWLAGADLYGADLTGAVLNGANLTGARLDRADLTGAGLAGAKLTRAGSHGANLTGADLFGAEVADAVLVKADLEGARLTEANLAGAVLDGANLTDARLTGANLTRAKLTEADLSGAQLTEANLAGAVLDGANLTDARLTEADLTGAMLTGADLTRAPLHQATLVGAQLRGANLTDARLTEADLTGARLYEALLTGARLLGADLTEAQLYEASFTGVHYAPYGKSARGVTAGQILEAAWLRGARLPPVIAQHPDVVERRQEE